MPNWMSRCLHYKELVIEELETISLDPLASEKRVQIGLSGKDIWFSYSRGSTMLLHGHTNMLWIYPEVAHHQLTTDPMVKLVQQKYGRFAQKWNGTPLQGLIHLGCSIPWIELYFCCGVKKKWRVCIDYTNHNKACLKDPFPYQKLIN